MTDIVAELRHRHRITTGLDPRITNPIVGPTIFLEAADEIERLRVVVQGWEHSSRNAERDIETLRAERDDARRSVCEMSIQLGGVYRRIGGKTVEVTTPEGCAEIMRWDCFKENTDG